MESIAQLNDIVIERGFDRKKLIKWIISTMMMFIPMLMQVNENYTTDIRIFFMITILVIMIWAFELMPLAAPACLYQLWISNSGSSIFTLDNRDALVIYRWNDYIKCF